MVPQKLNVSDDQGRAEPDYDSAIRFSHVGVSQKENLTMAERKRHLNQFILGEKA